MYADNPPFLRMDIATCRKGGLSATWVWHTQITHLSELPHTGNPPMSDTIEVYIISIIM